MPAILLFSVRSLAFHNESIAHSTRSIHPVLKLGCSSPVPVRIPCCLRMIRAIETRRTFRSLIGGARTAFRNSFQSGTNTSFHCDELCLKSATCQQRYV